MQSSLVPAKRKPVLIWLGACLLMVALMVTVGGLTRLTESGLSIVEWKPVHGTLPPLNEEEWREEFENYKFSPQYQQVNKGMALDEFRGIFWLEYIHRLLGRVTGLVFLLPFLFFWIRRAMPPALVLRMAGIFLLGGMQGVMGWYMVQSGLVDVPWVSPLRLMAHLGLAFIIFGLLWWHFLLIKWPASSPSLREDTTDAEATRRRLLRCARSNGYFALFTLALLCLQIMLGALVAGLDAGLLFDDFPTMNGEWVPAGIGALEPWYRNIYENPTAAHFLHRLGALMVTVGIAGLGCCLKGRLQPFGTVAMGALFATLALQILLGALTVIHHVSLFLAVLHQFVALLVFAAMLAVVYSLWRNPG